MAYLPLLWICFSSFLLMGNYQRLLLLFFLSLKSPSLSMNSIQQTISRPENWWEIQRGKFCYLIIQPKYFSLGRILTLTLIAWLRFANSLSSVLFFKYQYVFKQISSKSTGRSRIICFLTTRSHDQLFLAFSKANLINESITHSNHPESLATEFKEETEAASKEQMSN